MINKENLKYISKYRLYKLIFEIVNEMKNNKIDMSDFNFKKLILILIIILDFKITY